VESRYQNHVWFRSVHCAPFPSPKIDVSKFRSDVGMPTGLGERERERERERESERDQKGRLAAWGNIRHVWNNKQYTQNLPQSLNEKDHLGDKGLDGRIRLK